MNSRSPSELHVVLGASGGIGGAIVDALVTRGLPTRAVNRSGSIQRPGVQAMAADLMDPGQARRAVEGASVVYHAAMPSYSRWAQEFPTLNGHIIEAVAASDAALVYVDNLYMYGPGAGVMTEDSPQRATDKKGVVRARLATEMLEAHDSGRIRATIGRASDYFGPGGLLSATGSRYFEPAIAGKTVRWLGDLDAAHSFAYLPDLGRAYVTLGTDEGSLGRVWHLPTVGAPSGREFAAATERALGRPVKLAATSKMMVRLAGLFSADIRETVGVMYHWEEPFVVSDAAFQQTFGPQVATPLDDAVATTLAWFEEQSSLAPARA